MKMVTIHNKLMKIYVYWVKNNFKKPEPPAPINPAQRSDQVKKNTNENNYTRAPQHLPSPNPASVAVCVLTWFILEIILSNST